MTAHIYGRATQSAYYRRLRCQLSYVLCGLCYPIKQNFRHRERRYPCADHLLGENPEDSFALLVLRPIWTDSSTLLLHPFKRRYHTWPQFECWGCVGKIIVPKCKCREKLLNHLGLSPEQLSTGASFLTSCLTAQRPRRISSTRCLISLTNLCMSCRTLATRLIPPL